jgi:preprotein translocase subunit SecA
MNKQREVIYAQRRKVLNGESLKDSFVKMIDGVIDGIIATYCHESPHPDYWDWEGMISYAENLFMPKGSLNLAKDQMESFDKQDLKELMQKHALEAYEAKENDFGSELMRELERVVLLRVVDEKWMDNIDAMDQLRHGIGMRAYGQRDPVVEYKFEGFEMFEEMIKNIQQDSVKLLLRARIDKEHQPQREKVAQPLAASHGEDAPKKPVSRSNDKVGRNDLCPCGSGKKYKKCHGANE